MQERTVLTRGCLKDQMSQILVALEKQLRVNFWDETEDTQINLM